MAPRAGFEPATNRLTAGCSTTELPGSRSTGRSTRRRCGLRIAKTFGPCQCKSLVLATFRLYLPKGSGSRRWGYLRTLEFHGGGTIREQESACPRAASRPDCPGHHPDLRRDTRLPADSWFLDAAAGRARALG